MAGETVNITVIYPNAMRGNAMAGDLRPPPANMESKDPRAGAARDLFVLTFDATNVP